jgi:hypothetical protein
MEDIHIQANRNVYIQPQVDFSLSDGKCLIKGESFLEETAKFYTPLVEWVRNYPKYGSKIDFTFSLTYFNTSTSKWILLLLAELKKLENNGLEVNATWYYHEDDLDMRDDIADYMADTGLNIELVPFK